MATPSSPELWQAALHDLQGLLGSLKAALDLRGGGGSLDPEACSRLEAAVEDGIGRLGLARALALGPWPPAGALTPEAWKEQLRRQLAPIERLYRCPVELHLQGPDAPGLLAASWAMALSRLLMPQAVPGPMILALEPSEGGWTLAWSPVLGLPQSLKPGGEPSRAWDLHTLWVRAVAEQEGFGVDLEGETLRIRIPRKA
ncbi:MAG TPA: hypothetical protein VJ600_06410 [Holophagaceae bacterium]|nr:hypothetical protein [Holophagaceae bacterium]